jgi:hypothetical protein
MVEGLARVIYIKLCVYRVVSLTWKEGTEPVTEFAMDTKCRRSSSTLIDTVVHFDPKRCKREGSVILTNVLAEPLCLWGTCCEEVVEFAGGRCHRWKLDVSGIAAHCEEWMDIAASTPCRPFQEPVQSPTAGTGVFHSSKIVPLRWFAIWPSCDGQRPSRTCGPRVCTGVLC